MKTTKAITGGFIFLLIFTCSLLAKEQCTIYIEDYPVIGTTADYKVDTTGAIPIDANITSQGAASQSWNFTQQLTGLDPQGQYIDASTTPDYQTFPTAEWAFQFFQWISMDGIALIGLDDIDDLFTLTIYERSENNTVYGIGVNAITPFYEGALPFDNEATNYVFPMEMGGKWTRKSRFSTTATFGSITADPLVVSDSAVVEVDAWGDLTIPCGTFTCVRLKIIRRLLIKANTFLGWYDVEDKTYIAYEWFAKDVGLLLQITSHGNEQNENFTDASLVVRLEDSNKLTGVEECDPGCNTPHAVPTQFALHQNIPNPFNPTTSIQYSLPTASVVELKIFSILGREVATVESGMKKAGVQEAIWHGKDSDGHSVPGGIYFYQLKATPPISGETIVQTKKMILMK
jgi:hypothetical protein